MFDNGKPKERLIRQKINFAKFKIDKIGDIFLTKIINKYFVKYVNGCMR